MVLRILYIILFIILNYSNLQGQQLKFIKEADLEEILKNQDNKLHVISLWASWCPPCVREMPVFQNTSFLYNTTEVRFIMISLDYPDKMETQLIPFLKKYDINLEVLLMMDTDYLKWADKVDPDFQGNIPSTLFINNAKKIRHFHAGEITATELRSIIDKLK